MMLRNKHIIDISQWNEKLWFHTKGSRDKAIVEDENNNEYYFKTSLFKPNKDYKYEFWSEVIASELGKLLELPVLNYGVAIKNDIIGCISPSINKEKQQLIEGEQYLKALNFDPKTKVGRQLYSFQLIEKALTYSGLSIFMDKINEVIFFDAIIGNQDRHQENWGVIINFSDSKSQTHSDARHDYQRRLELVKYVSPYRINETQEYRSLTDLSSAVGQSFAPIYDNGSSLCRELGDEVLKNYLKDQNRFDAYIRKGKSEIRWQNNQLNHTDLVKKVVFEADYMFSSNALKQIVERYTESRFRRILDSVDKNIPVNFANVKLKDERKELIVRMVSRRVDLLKALI